MTAPTIGATTAMVAALRRPTPPEQVQWRGDRTTSDKTRISVLAYIDARYVMELLDECVLPENWQDRYEDTPGGYRCGIGVFVNGQWVWKWDAHGQTDVEPVKGGHSKALVRAGVKWGIARDLYDLPDLWVPARSFETRSGTKYEPAVLPTWNGSAWVTDSIQSGGRATPPPARPSARPSTVTAAYEQGGTAAAREFLQSVPEPPLFDGDPEFAPIGGSASAEIPTDHCPIHNEPWRGDPGDLYHGPKGIVPTGYCRHPDNVKKTARRAS